MANVGLPRREFHTVPRRNKIDFLFPFFCFFFTYLMRIFALLTKPPQFCSKRLFLHDSTLMTLWGAGISSLNIAGVYILFSRFSARSVLTQTRTPLWNSVLFPFFLKNTYQRGQVPLTPALTQPSEGGGRPCYVRNPDNHAEAPSAEKVSNKRAVAWFSFK